MRGHVYCIVMFDIGRLDKWREFLGRGDMYESAEIQYLKRQGAYLERYRKHMEVCRVRTV